MERRLSGNSESSIEPMDISSSNKTGSSEANSSLALKTSNDSDNIDSDEHEEYQDAQNLMRRDNLRQLMDNMLRKKFLNLNNDNVNSYNNNNNYENNDAIKYVCPICETISTTQHEFTEHIRSHNNKSEDTQNFTCKICSKVLSSASSLDRHVLVHTGERPFTCKYCNLTFTTNGNMHRHMRTHKQSDRENYESDGSTDSTGSLGSNNNNNNYAENESKRKNTDDNLNYKRKIKTINNNIINTTTMQKFCCPVCTRNDFSSMLCLENHMDKEHPSIPAKCRHCEIVFKSHKALNAHRCGNNNYQNITQGFKDLTFVDFSSEKFPYIAKSVCEQSIRTPVTNQKFECTKCYRAFPCASAVDIHTKSCGLLDNTNAHDYSIGNRKRKCSDSSEEEARRDDFFANLDLQNKSMSTNISSNNSEPPTTPSSIEKSFTSPLLQREIKQEPYFNNYQHDTKDLADIQSIINVTSSGGFFRQLDHHAMEKEQYHGGQKEEAEEAQDAFTAEFRKMKLRGEFPCRLCTAIFPNLRALKGHNRVHLSAAGPGPYRCNMCPYSINDKATLIRHMRTHNGDRPYECSICNYAFTTKANCERHLRNRHGKTTREDVKKSIIYHPSEDSSCDDPMKKIQMFNSPDFDKDDEHPKDRSTPVSHLKEMLLPMPMSLINKIESPAKIQVKSLDQLTQHSIPHPEKVENFEKDVETVHETKPMDLSMDALDLSKKAKSVDFEEQNDENDDEPEDDRDEENDEDDEDDEDEEDSKMPKLDLSMFEKNQHLLLMQQKLLNEALPKMDPTHYFQLSQLYRSFGFPAPAFPIHPLFLQNPLLAPTALNDMKNFFQKDFLPMPQMSGGSLVINPFSSPSPSSSPTGGKPIAQPQTPPSHTPQPQSPHKIPPMSPQTKPPQSQQPPVISHSSPVPMGNGPVKMVIKNGVLMPKQKQRRYRTERPFACEHCSARFTLRSNMERHIKQQHPQFWAQRQRGNQHLIRRGSNVSSSPSAPPVIQTIPNSNSFGGISEQVKFAILAQQQKARESPKMMLQNLIAQNNRFNNNNNNSSMANHNTPTIDDDEPQLVIDEEFQPEDLSKSIDTDMEQEQMMRQKQMEEESERQKIAARAVAENILEQAMRQNNSMNLSIKPPIKTENKDFDMKIIPNLIQKSPENESQFYKNNFNADNIKEEADLVSVSKLVDNATNVAFENYFRPDPPMAAEQSDEEGLVASGSASESNNSGTDDPNPTQIMQKKKSAYSLAPNRVSCPYCQRMFPWSSSLRRHILTHTGQKPFKCSHCPLLFTTKSNCDRHLLRKHGNVESAMSVPVPIDDIPDPKPEPVPAAIAAAAAAAAATANQEFKNNNYNKESVSAGMNLTKSSSTTPTLNIPIKSESYPSSQQPQPATNIMNSDLPFKCHLCDGSFSDRLQCLEHIKNMHPPEFTLLMTKVTLEQDQEVQTASPDDEEGGDNKGKYPDYANRKVICAFCLRRFWSTEDLRRHMRTHSGERPFQCDICYRKFTLKHSMLRHRKKHTSPNGTPANQNAANNNASASDLSDDEQPSNLMIAHSKLLSKLPELFNRQNNRKFEEDSDLIGNLLGISDQGILNRVLLSSASEAAKLLGVEK